MQQSEQNTQVKVLMYHRIVRNRALSDRFWFCVHEDDFRTHLEHLEQWGYTTITFEDYRLYLAGALDLPRKAVILTFDDGYLDAYNVAFPILEELQMKAVLFVLGERRIKTNVWDERLGIPTARLMEDEQILEFHAAGHEIGSHSMDHSDLTSLREDEVWREVTRSRMLLEILLNRAVRTFSYPFGKVNTVVKRAVANAGYDLACCGEGGPVNFCSDPLEIKRIKIASHTGPFGLALRMRMPFEYLTAAYGAWKNLELPVISTATRSKARGRLPLVTTKP